ncbi:MAG: transketolase [Alphaproteobacteria bacterium]|nr:transketolase [Alphaproteobacteria bacterium]MDE2012956.1 transketolase [Alphaproteobacteria bacterium]MDE2074595.1 transketolase [Alphaproteobacteria bacterium]MDE2351431.1 transketolase [Alphaproteobacteria bacterium]
MPTHRELANALRFLAIDAVQQANSGHPGAPLGMADMAEVLWRGFLRHNPSNPAWWDRDRFVLSNGHASALLYALLHLSGYPVGLEDLQGFRQLGSRTAGHPERDLTMGIETTTGPLGQGIANAVGLALAEKVLAARFNRPGLPVIDHYTWVFAGDGCLMEGVSHEAASLAGTFGLGKLICLYDDNGISIDGNVRGWFGDDTALRFEAYGWQVIRSVDGHDAVAVENAIRAAQAEPSRPSLICCKTVIGYGSPKRAGTAKAHGEPLGAEEIAAVRNQLGWEAPPFVVPDGIRVAWNAQAAGRAAETAWQELWARYRAQYPAPAEELQRRMEGKLPGDFGTVASQAIAAAAAAGPQATRVSSQGALNVFGAALSEMLGGSADLTGSNNTMHKASRAISTDQPDGNYLHYGVREFGMSAIMNGLALHGGFIPYGGTFLTFSDYARNAVRMAALMHQRVIHVYTHDSIGLGEDGPTHQPIEHAASLRLIPNLSVWRPADAVETAVAWSAALAREDGPAALLLTRQALPPLADAARANDIARGGYVLLDCEGTPDALVIATGSEIHIAAEAVKEAQAQGLRVRLVSMPSTDVFDRQDASWRDAVLPTSVTRRVVVEAGSTAGWWRYAGSQGRVLGIDRFGASGKAADLYRYFGLTAERISEALHELL